MFIILLISFNCFVSCLSCVSNSTGKFAGKPVVVGGYRPEKGSFAKYVVSIRRQETEKHFGYTHFCAGSIIAANKILTAAHCFYRKRTKFLPQDYKVVAKTPNRLNKNSKTQEMNIESLILHPDYRKSTLFNDIAIVMLKGDIEMDFESAAIIPITRLSVKTGTLCQVIGWGKLYQDGPLANEILHVDLNLQSREYCRKLYPNFNSKKLCASSNNDKERDACNGDSGGPMICQGSLTGIVSYGYGCASGRDGIYTNVLKYLDWITNNGKTFLKPSFLVNIKSWLFILLV